MKKVQFEYGLFEKSTTKGVYDIVGNKLDFPFYFLKFSAPKSQYLLDNGAVHFVQSWTEGKEREREKTLHSGLIPIDEPNFFYGDCRNNKGKKDFILIRWVPEKSQVHFWLIKNCNPKNKKSFTKNFISYLIKTKGMPI